MYQNKIKDLPKLASDNYENIFQIYQDENERYYYNILQNINIPTNLPGGYYNEYLIKYGDTWPLISYRVYETPNLWWIVLAANNIINPVNLPEQGTIIKVFKTSVVRTILTEIQSQIK